MAAGLPWLVYPVWADPLVFIIALAIVKFRPQGLIGKGRL
jgi:branched-chain amino acid transport system permease protein